MGGWGDKSIPLAWYREDGWDLGAEGTLLLSVRIRGKVGGGMLVSL